VNKTLVKYVDNGNIRSLKTQISLNGHYYTAIWICCDNEGDLWNAKIWWQYIHISFLAHLAEGHESLCHGAASVVRPASSFLFKRLLLKNH